MLLCNNLCIVGIYAMFVLDELEPTFGAIPNTNDLDNTILLQQDIPLIINESSNYLYSMLPNEEKILPLTPETSSGRHRLPSIVEDKVASTSNVTSIFYAIGDVPYNTDQATKLKTDIISLPKDAEFLIHVGDIRNANQVNKICRKEEYTNVANILRLSRVPVFIVRTLRLDENFKLICQILEKHRFVPSICSLSFLLIFLY
jgi:hypothetical protein